ncbi:MAG: hypothetical protein Q7T47_00620 [Anaerolineales bacterium]|nr:hypothetical protein [Anaerolineales bacterium]
MPGNKIYPHYSYPLHAIPGLATDVLLGRRRDFRRDARLCSTRLKPPLRVYGGENIPQSGACVLTFNHYYRPGFKAWWLALGIASVVPVDMHWIVTGELTFPGRWYAPLGRPISRWLLKRVSHIYGFTTMPPMPPRQRDVEARAGAVLEALSYVQHTDHTCLGLAPEGGDNPGGGLSWPASGAGRFGLLLAGCGLRFVPLGAYEAQGEFCLQFGTAYELGVPRGLSPDEKDHQAARIIMQNIARQLPVQLRGEFDVR